MSCIAFPDPNVVSAIDALASEFGFEIVGRDYVHHSQMDDLMRSYKDDKWGWSLARPNSETTMNISIYYPSYMVGVSFENSSPDKKEKMSTHFFFVKYLFEYVKNGQDARVLSEIAEESSWKDKWPLYLEVLKRHLRADLALVVEGSYWPNIEFNIKDYVEPAALERMCEEGKQMIERKPGGWLYFIDFFKKR